MAQPSYNIENVYRAISTINGYFSEEKQYGATIQRTDPIIHTYCHYGNTKGKCGNYFQMASSGVIHLLKKLKGMSGLECDKLAEYAILWLSYKLAIKPNNNGIDLNHFYTNYIIKNNDYNKKIKNDDSLTYKAIIDTKKDFMNIKEIYNFSYLFSILFYLYNVNNPNNLKCTNNSNYPENFANKFKELNEDSNINGNTSYRKLLSTLSDDYDNLKKIYVNNKSCNFPLLPQIEPKKSLAQNPAEISGRGFEQISGQTSEVISSSSSISTTLIPGLSVVSAIPVFLGIAYKTIYKKKIKKNNEENEN
ncbi:PIR protein CIR protein [Plasmodium vinckei petteri]|uniref:PIR protein CIR protein n=1 Tax=Plasmodium vinckei petteri TaxID=138298 RepID=A0A6V7SRI2_PLAVN|nr:PIR protein CIR protein [Plasmodium vinckei petteri]